MATKTTIYPLRLYTPTPDDIFELRVGVMQLSQQKFGSLVYVTCGTVQNWENGKTTMNPIYWKFINEYVTNSKLTKE